MTIKSGEHMLRVLLVLFLFSALTVEADAFPVHDDVNSLIVDSQYKSEGKHQSGNTDTVKSVRKNATPMITLVVIPYQERIAQISWETTDPTIPGIYNVERLNPSGWVIIKQLPFDAILKYNDTITYPFCTASEISYRIRFISVLDNITSQEEHVNLYDQTPPDEVQNLIVNINATGFPELTWIPVTGYDIFEYRIQSFISPDMPWQTIANVPGGSNSFVDNIPATELNVCDKSYKYVVSSIDRCGIFSDENLYDDIAVQTIRLDPSIPGQCDRFSNLVWNSYINMPGGLGGYMVYRNDEISTIKIGTTSDTTYVDNFGFNDGVTYTYTVIAYSNDLQFMSTSCLMGWTYSGLILPDTVYITRVSVEDDSYIRINYYFTPAGSVVKLILERSDDNLVSFQAIDSLPVSVGLVPENSYFNDTTADVYSQSYHYRLVAIDDCGYKTFSINVSRSIWLQCDGSETQNTLNWNSYQYWLQGVNEYEVYRSVVGQSPTTEMIGSVQAAPLEFHDLLSTFDHSMPVCYWVEASENPLNPYLSDAISKSNTCCIIKDPVMFMPNAFHPYGINMRFRPVPDPVYVDAQTFRMIVFNRWGQQIFETMDMGAGWDGTVNSEVAPVGLYSYIIKYKSVIGKEYIKRGTFMLLQ